MAQQTQVARVLDRYERWLTRWPTAAALAAATRAEVLTEWSAWATTAVRCGYRPHARSSRATAGRVTPRGCGGCPASGPTPPPPSRRSRSANVERLSRVLTALEREGLVEWGPAGVGLPGQPR